MKLDNKQINAVATKLAREINESNSLILNEQINKKLIELQDKLDHDFIVIKAALSKLPIKVDIRVILEYPGGSTYFQEGQKVTKYQAEKFFKFVSPDINRIKEDIIIEQIEDHKSLESLINTIKNKYVTN